jgi:DNA processing protein
MNTNVQPVASTRSSYAPPWHHSTLPHSQCGLLYVAGDVSLLERKAVAVIGSRNASPIALDLAEAVATSLVQHDVVVVSGLAAGVDAAAQRAAVRAGGHSIGVIGTALDRAYPASNATLQERIHRDHLLVSPFAPATVTAPWHFPVRDRVIARLSVATILVEASEKSGTRYVVEECVRRGKAVFARKGLLDGLSWLRRAAVRGDVVEWDKAGDIVRRL